MEHSGLQEFVNYLEGERGFSSHTLRAYLNDLDQFCDYVENGPKAFERPSGEERPPGNLAALERAAQPLVSGIYTADPEKLSVLATMPRFLEMEAEHRSLILAMRRAGRDQAKRGEAGARYSLFVALKDGMQTLPDALQAALPDDVVQLNRQVTSISKTSGGTGVSPVSSNINGANKSPTNEFGAEPGSQVSQWRIELTGGDSLTCDGVIVTAPAHRAAPRPRGASSFASTPGPRPVRRPGRAGRTRRRADPTCAHRACRRRPEPQD